MKNPSRNTPGAAVGTTPRDQLRWLQSFAERSLDDREVVQRTREEVMCFCRHWYRDPYGDEDVFIPALDVQPIEHTTVRKLQRNIAQPIVNYLRGGRSGFIKGWLGSDVSEQEFQFGPMSVRFGVGWNDPPRPAVAIIEGATPAAQFACSIVRLIEACGDRLRRCQAPNCTVVFVLVRRTKRNCSPRCTNRVTARRFRAKHPNKPKRREIPDARHQRHARKQRARLGPEVKVSRRRRGKG